MPRGLGLFQLVEQGNLGGDDGLFCGVQREPASFIHFRKCLLFSRAARPFQLERIADDGCRIDIAGGRPGIYAFAPFLSDRAEGLEGTFEGDACFFPEFADGRIECGFIIGKFTFWYGPGAGVFVFPEGASGVDEEYFEICMAPV